MIEFKGEYSEKNKLLLIKQSVIVGAITSLIMFVIFGSIVVGASVYTKNWYLLFLLIVIVLIGVTFTCSPFLEKGSSMKNGTPECIALDTERGVLYIEMPKINRIISHEMCNIGRVVETEDSYYIYIGSKKLFACICQKDLLVNGTLDDFEEAFKGLIVRK